MRASKSLLRAAYLAAAGLGAMIALSGCQDILNSILDNAAPTGLSASDGDYADSIYVSWGAPNISSDKWAGYSIVGYDISWTGPLSNTVSLLANVTNYSITAGNLVSASKYNITVTTKLSAGSLSGGSATDTGFALPAQQDLIWKDGGGNYTVSGGEQWYVTMLQKGFTYNFDFGGGSGTVEFYPYKSLTLAGSTGTGSSVSWTCDAEGNGHKFYVHVVPSAPGTFTASYSF
jgi:hypothetical protein